MERKVGRSEGISSSRCYSRVSKVVEWMSGWTLGVCLRGVEGEGRHTKQAPVGRGGRRCLFGNGVNARSGRFSVELKVKDL